MRKIFVLGFVFLFAQIAQFAQADELKIGSTNRRYPEVKSFLAKLSQDYPNNVSLFNLGENDFGEQIQGVKIGNGPVRNIVVGTHHGNEYGSTEVALGFAESIAKAPVSGQTIYVIPVLNITGYNARRRNETDNANRSFDPNRNYPSPCGTEGPLTLKSTRALAEFVAREGIVASATLHTFYPAVVYPWGISSHDLDTAYPDIFRKLVNDATVESKYQTGNSTEVIYPADGTYEDYAFMQHGVWSILFELGYSHSPNEAQIQTMVQVGVPGMRRMFENAPTMRAAQHSFQGRCDRLLNVLDRHDE